MTGTTTQAMLDLADLFHGAPAETKPAIQARVTSLLESIIFFGIGCGAAALVYSHAHKWVFVGGPILSAITVALYIREKRSIP